MDEEKQGVGNPFDAPIPGQSLTDEPGNYPWEHPPKTASIEEATDMVYDSLMNEKNMSRMFTLLRMGIPIEALVKVITFSGFLEGKWTVDMAIILSEIVFKQIMAIGMKLKIKDLKLFMGDQSNNKFHMDFANFKSLKKKGQDAATPGQTDAEKFAAEIKAELESKEPSGLMKKETE